jgi:hypothetical protein
MYKNIGFCKFNNSEEYLNLTYLVSTLPKLNFIELNTNLDIFTQKLIFIMYHFL